MTMRAMMLRRRHSTPQRSAMAAKVRSVTLVASLLMAVSLFTPHAKASEFHFIAPIETADYEPSLGEGFFSLTVSVQEVLDVGEVASNTAGFTMSLLDSGGWLSVQYVEPSAALNSLRAGLGPEFFAANLTPEGWSLNVAYSLDYTELSQFGILQEVATIHYATESAQFVNSSDEVMVELTWQDSVSGPPLSNTMIDSNSVAIDTLALENGSVTLSPNGTLFLRGDANNDGAVNIADTITILGYVGDVIPASPTLRSAGDVNDNGVVEIADVALLNCFLFGLVTTLAAPFPSPGVDLTPFSTFPPAEHSLDYVFSLSASSAWASAGETVFVSSQLTSESAVEGFQQFVTYDPTVLQLVGTSGAESVEALVGATAAFHSETSESAGQILTATLVDFFSLLTIPPGVGAEISVFEFVVSSGVSGSIEVDVGFGNSPNVGFYNNVSVAVEAIWPTLIGTVEAAGGDPVYRRGDINSDGSINLADVTTVLSFLFPLGPAAVPQLLGRRRLQW